MKKIINITAFFILVFAGMAMYGNGCGNSVTRQEFDNYRQEFRKEITQIKTDLDTVKKDVRYVKRNTDSLRRGQAVIYRNVKKQAEKRSFIDNINDLF